MRILKSSGLADKAGIAAGDRLLEINGEPVLDFIDYQALCAQRHLTLKVLGKTGARDVKISKAPHTPLGLDMGEALYPPERECCNACIFCFVDQLPCDMREGMRVKDDDWRYSVLFGNFITLTNVDEAEFQRIIRRGASPLNVSVHATEPSVRALMLGNPKGGEIMGQLERLVEAGIRVNAQAVLVPGINDGEILMRTMEDLCGLGEGIVTFAAVPVGLTQARDGLADIRMMTPAEARDAIECVEDFAARTYAREGRRFAFASDELYFIAGMPYPRYPDGEYMPQLGNGVGMYADFRDGQEEAARLLDNYKGAGWRITCVTGVAATPIIKEAAAAAMGHAKGVRIDVLTAQNATFGETVTVAGLLGGGDILRALEGHDVGLGLLIPSDALREDVFADDMTLAQLKREIGAPVKPVLNFSDAFMEAVLALLEE